MSDNELSLFRFPYNYFEKNLWRGNKYLTSGCAPMIPPYILLTTNDPGHQACQRVLDQALLCGIEVRMAGTSPVSISKLDDLSYAPPGTKYPHEDFEDEDAAKKLHELGYTLVELPDFFIGSPEDDGSRYSDGSVPTRVYAVKMLNDDFKDKNE